MNNVIAESPLIKEHYNNSTVYKKYVYVDCLCGHYGDAIRILVSKEKDANNKDFNNEVSFEFNVRDIYVGSRKNFLISFFGRLVIAFKVLLGIKVYTTSDVLVDFEGASRMVSKITEAINEVSSLEEEKAKV